MPVESPCKREAFPKALRPVQSKQKRPVENVY